MVEWLDAASQNFTAPGALARRLAGVAELTLLLDYDGTLVPFAPRPNLAAPDVSLLQLIERLVLRRGARVEIVSGRDPTTLDRWFGSLPIGLRAEHGVWSRPYGETAWKAGIAIDPRAVALAVERLTALTTWLGGWVEPKSSGAAWHYRGVDVSASSADWVVHNVESQLGPVGFSALRGACVVEARACGINKGVAAEESLAKSSRTTVVAIGDDTTDEDMFRVLRAPHVGVVVGQGARATAASHRFVGVPDVRSFLTCLVTAFE